MRVIGNKEERKKIYIPKKTVQCFYIKQFIHPDVLENSGSPVPVVNKADSQRTRQTVPIFYCLLSECPELLKRHVSTTSASAKLSCVLPKSQEPPLQSSVLKVACDLKGSSEVYAGKQAAQRAPGRAGSLLRRVQYAARQRNLTLASQEPST